MLFFYRAAEIWETFTRGLSVNAEALLKLFQTTE